jgi:uncharacterized protein YbjQ (UPF0145 family)|nr:heavy metal-binding domain-containing protein [Kofleriaceae bacterium]
MSLFSKGPPQQPPQQPAAADPNAFTPGPAERQRLAELRGDADGKPLFTSDLGVNEYLLIKNAGFDPLGLVIGSSIYHVGYQPTQWTVSQEMTVLSQAMYNARELAMSRLEQEAAAIGADGVVGVRLQVGRYAWGEGLAEFVAVGTAVRARDGQSYRAPNGMPFTSDLSGQEFAVLRSMGHVPVGMVMGSCVYHVAHQSWKQYRQTTMINVEMGNFTQALYDARELAMERMQAEAKTLGAEGIVGVDLVQGNHGWEGHVLEFLAIGTAIVTRVATMPTTTPFVVDVGHK